MISHTSVRQGRPHELPEIVALAGATYGAPQWSFAQYEAILDEGDHEVSRRALFVVEHDTQIQGFYAASVAADQAELESIVVAAQRRRTGLGRKLCQHALSWAKQQGAEEMWLEVRASNRAAQALYESQGFATGGLRKSYYKHPTEDAVVMRAILTGATHI